MVVSPDSRPDPDQLLEQIRSEEDGEDGEDGEEAADEEGADEDGAEDEKETPPPPACGTVNMTVTMTMINRTTMAAPTTIIHHRL